eukprot:1269323-Prymnesium_polylepis.1
MMRGARPEPARLSFLVDQEATKSSRKVQGKLTLTGRAPSCRVCRRPVAGSIQQEHPGRSAAPTKVKLASHTSVHRLWQQKLDTSF